MASMWGGLVLPLLRGNGTSVSFESCILYDPVAFMRMVSQKLSPPPGYEKGVDVEEQSQAVHRNRNYGIVRPAKRSSLKDVRKLRYSNTNEQS